MSRSIAIIAVAALIGAALGAAVTLPTLVVIGNDTPPAALPFGSGGGEHTVVRATPLPVRHAKVRRSART